MESLRTARKDPSGFLGTILRLVSANVINNLVSLAVTLFAARALGPVEFGKVGLALSIVMLLPLVYDFGLSTALVKHHQKPIAAIRGPIEASVVPVLRVKTVLALAMVMLALVFTPFLNSAVFPTLAGTGSLLVLSAVSGGLLSLWATLRAAEQARQEYRAIEKNTFLYALLRGVSALVLFHFSGVTATTTLLALYVLPLALFVLGHSLLGNSAVPLGPVLLRSQPGEGQVLRALWRYGGWVGVSASSFVALSRLPQFVLEHRATTAEVGTYSAALTFLAAFSLLNDAVRLVMLPRASGLSTAQERARFRKQVRGFLPRYAVLMAIATPVVAAAALVLLGEPYRASIPVLLILSITTLTGMYLGIFNTLLHAHEQPQYDAAVNIGRLVVLLALLLTVPPTPLWAAAALAVTQILGEVVLYFLVSRLEAKAEGAKEMKE
ncbi:lipopolysaccharide biosynthesis protein [Deinococcus aestuarii]|uniref:lipopolysaccharide biosynthesis protein n=1 Tax=Deinococcus aestuarii TaxID=2774531 RepID=UPI002484842F|nr:oligosaccharide flippase family protein [Deinococcus aestuarii]